MKIENFFNTTERTLIRTLFSDISNTICVGYIAYQRTLNDQRKTDSNEEALTQDHFPETENILLPANFEPELPIILI